MSTATSFQLLSSELSSIVERIGPSVVSVRSGHGAASGTVIAPDRIVMADHGLDPDADTAQVFLGDAAREARVLGRDPASDLAVLTVAGGDLPPVQTSETPPAVGQAVLSVGRAWDRLVAGFGIIHRHVGPVHRRHATRLETALSTTIAPYPGYSGGPLLDASGRVVGIATAGLQRGAAWAIPVGMVLRRAESLATHGRIRRGFLGVTSMRVHLPPAQQGPGGERSGLLITSLAAEGPAALAGILVGDVLIRLDDKPLETPEQLFALLTDDAIGRAWTATVVRGTQGVPLNVTIGERSAA